MAIISLSNTGRIGLCRRRRQFYWLSSFSGLLTHVEMGHIRIGSAESVRTRSQGSASSLSQRASD